MFYFKRYKLLWILLHLIVSLVGFTGAQASELETGKYSVYNPGNRYVPKYNDKYVDDVQKIFSKRCASCHSCNSGPCQLNLTSYEGLVRGMSKDNPHDLERQFLPVKRARLADHYSVEKYRSMGFYPVVNQSKFTSENEQSIMYLALLHGENSPAPDKKTIRELGLHQESEKYQCPVTPEEFDQFTVKFPFGGMPFGCPTIEQEYVDTLKEWILDGGKGPSKQAQKSLSTPVYTSHTLDNSVDMVKIVEQFLNRDSYAHQAVARYIYEHTFTLDIHFDNNPGEFYRIVRSKAKAPKPIDLIVTEFPTDNPGIGSNRVYYRLEKLDRVVEMKKHSVWELSEQELKEIDKIFFATNWSVNKLPGYPKNPFEWFHVIPAKSRANFIIRYVTEIWHSVARGGICHSRAASFIKVDYGWYMTLKPESDPTVMYPKLGMANYDNFYTYPNDAYLSTVALQYHREPLRYREAFEKYLRKMMPDGLGIEDLEEQFFFGIRHETSMEYFSSKDTPVPGYPVVNRIISYADHEKFYYRTVAQYRWWGSTFHKAEAFIQAAYTRTFGENLFASLHPNPKERKRLMNVYSSLKGRLFYGTHKDFSKGRGTKIPADWNYEKITRKILERAKGKLTEEVDSLNNWPLTNLRKEILPYITNLEDWEAGIRTLTGKKAAYPQFLPNVVHIRLEGEHLYTLFVERAHSHSKIPGQEESDRDPKNDVLRAWKGFTGAFPHLYIDLKFEDASSFLKDLSKVDSIEDWVKVDERYGMDRNDPEFWPFTDWLHDWVSKNLGAKGGILDLRNYDLRDKPF